MMFYGHHTNGFVQVQVGITNQAKSKDKLFNSVNRSDVTLVEDSIEPHQTCTYAQGRARVVKMKG
jgi:hypothetical protein